MLEINGINGNVDREHHGITIVYNGNLGLIMPKLLGIRCVLVLSEPKGFNLNWVYTMKIYYPRI